MNKKEILSAIKGLASSQGFYGRLYHKLTDGSRESAEFLTTIENEKFSDKVEMVMWLES